MKDRNHNYLYTVELRVKSTDLEGKSIVSWREHQVEACNIWQVIGKLDMHEDDIRYLHKTIL